MSDRVSLAIATTGGPSIVKNIYLDAQSTKSEIVLHGRSFEPVEVDAHFDRFMRSLRAELDRIGVHVGPPDQPIIIEVSETIDSGDSWQLGVAAALMLFAEQRLAMEGTSVVSRILATGSFNTSGWSVKAVQHIPEKLEAAAAFIAPGPNGHGDTTFLMPEENSHAINGPSPEALVIGVASLKALADVVALGPSPPVQSVAGWRPRWRRPIAIGGVLVAVAALLIFQSVFRHDGQQAGDPIGVSSQAPTEEQSPADMNARVSAEALSVDVLVGQDWHSCDEAVAARRIGAPGPDLSTRPLRPGETTLYVNQGEFVCGLRIQNRSPDRTMQVDHDSSGKFVWMSPSSGSDGVELLARAVRSAHPIEVKVAFQSTLDSPTADVAAGAQSFTLKLAYAD